MPLVSPPRVSSPSTGGTADGTVVISTQVQTGNFNQAIKKVSSSSSGILLNMLRGTSSIANVLKGLISFTKILAGVVVGLTVGFFLLIVAIQRFTSRLFSALERNIDRSSVYFKMLEGLRTQFSRLEGSVFALFSTLLAAATPLLTRFVDWLTTLIDKANMLIAALLGQKTVLKAIVKTTKDQAKAQKEVLAAFDEINVLQKEQQDKQDTNPITFIEVPVEQKIKDWVTKFKQGFSEAWKWLQDLWGSFEESPIGKFFAGLLEKLGELATWIKEHPKEFGEFIGILTAVGFAFLALTLIILGIIGVITILSAVVSGAIAVFTFLTSPIGLVIIAIIALIAIIVLLITHWDLVKAKASEAWNWTKKEWGEATDWFKNHVIDPIKSAFSDTWEAIKAGFKSAWDGVVLAGKIAVNGIIGLINGLIQAVVDGVNGIISALNSIQIDLPSWLPFLGGQHFGLSIPNVSAPRIPLLAQGAVIPPNASFLAMLGDQTNGKNLEAPEGLIRQIIQDEIGNITANITVKFEGSMAELVRQLKPFIDKENVRVGNSAITGNVTV